MEKCMMNTELNINLQDTQWQYEYVDHDRNIPEQSFMMKVDNSIL